MTDNEYKDIPHRVKALRALTPRTPEANRLRDEVINQCLPLAEHIARRFEGRGEPKEDLLQVARLGLINAVDRFDPEMGSDFVSFAVPTVMGEVRRHFRDTGWAVRVPRRIKEIHLAVGKAVGALSQRLGRAPTAPEIAQDLGVALEDVESAMLAGSAYSTSSLEAPATSNPDHTPLSESIGDYDEALSQVDDHEALRPLLAELPERERAVIMLRFFGNQTQTQIAQQLGISQMHVSRLLARTLKQLHDRLDQ